jgi:hypothetical protein
VDHLFLDAQQSSCITPALGDPQSGRDAAAGESPPEKEGGFSPMNGILLRSTSWIGVLVLTLILGSCGGDTRQEASSLPIPTYPTAAKIRIDPTARDGVGYPYEQTTFETGDDPATILAWYHHELTARGWTPIQSTDDPQTTLIYHDPRNVCPRREIFVRIGSVLLGRTAVEMGSYTRPCRRS